MNSGVYSREHFKRTFQLSVQHSSHFMTKAESNVWIPRTDIKISAAHDHKKTNKTLFGL